MSAANALPPGPNVGTQLAALHRARARRVTPKAAEPRPTGSSAGVIARDAEGWFTTQGWQPFDFQREVWAHMAAGRSGLLHATTGAGKTLAAWFGALAVCRAVPAPTRGGPRVLWITPMRALAADTTLALQAAADGLGMGWAVEQRTGDTAAATKARQRKTWPPALVTTPESLSLILALADSEAVLGDVQVLTTPDKIAEYLRDGYAKNPCQEGLWVVCLDRKNKPISRTMVTLGTLTSALAHPREVFKIAILASAAAIVVSHNHPSGDPTPSAQDVQMTRQLREASKIIGIDLIDHVIVGAKEDDPQRVGYYSFRAAGML